jgi:DNA-binding CsgD family transcriptional regulator
MDVDYRLAFDWLPWAWCFHATAPWWTATGSVRNVWRLARGADRPVVPDSLPQRRRVRTPGRTHGAHPERQGPLRRQPHHEARQRRVFWCHVSGRALNREAPHESGIWSFEDLSSQRPVKAELTGREREVAARLLEGLTSKEIGKALEISHRTVEIYRARLMRKYNASTAADLVHKLLAQRPARRHQAPRCWRCRKKPALCPMCSWRWRAARPSGAPSLPTTMR